MSDRIYSYSNQVFSYAVVNYLKNDSNYWDRDYYSESYTTAMKWIKCNKNNLEDYYIAEFRVFKTPSDGKLYFDKIRVIDKNTIDLLMASDSTIIAKVRVAGTEDDRRRRLTDRQIAEIKAYYKHRIFSISELCEIYDVSYTTIKYHVDEEFKKTLNKRRKYYAHSPKNLVSQANYKRSLILRNANC